MYCSGLSKAIDYFLIVAGCACLIFGGPALIIAGSIFIKKDDGRNGYNEAVGNFDPAFINAWTGTINGMQTVVRRESLDVNGASSAMSVFVEAVIPVLDPTLTTLLFLVNVSTVTPFIREANFQVGKLSKFSCNRHTWMRAKSRSCSYELRNFEDKCKALKGVFDGSPSSCETDHICAECITNAYLSRLYLVAQEVSKGNYTEDTTLRSAKYDFDDLDNDYQLSVPSDVVVRLYSNKDPYIALQQATRGTGEFGLNPRTIGIVLIVLGIAFLLLEVCSVMGIICYCMRQKNDPPGGPSQIQDDAPPTTNTPGNVPLYSDGQQPPGHTNEEPPAQGYVYGQAPA
ncbi:surface glycoprotein [Trypanosoma rangeli SC58]|uniref:Surface glycoprotein n=1 Tax=Trypanosoma rangeli SC58 TaxID=429131 RepID=A0A061IWF6_TRYRA|nr:surface glycoprotein [Trypanosoma rangeli SC58]